MVEFYEDLYDSKPLEAHRNEDGEIQFTDTGDDMIDKWEAELASGQIPDLWESFSPDMQKTFKERAAADPKNRVKAMEATTKRGPSLSMAEVSANIARQNEQELAQIGAAKQPAQPLRAFQKLRR